MKVSAEISVVPLGVGVSLSEYIAACFRILQQAGLKTDLHAFGTNVEGEWDQVMQALKDCHVKVHEMGAPRVSTSVKLATRTDFEQSLGNKVESVQQELSRL